MFCSCQWKKKQNAGHKYGVLLKLLLRFMFKQTIYVFCMNLGIQIRDHVTVKPYCQ